MPKDRFDDDFVGGLSFFNHLFGTIAGYSTLDRVVSKSSFVPTDDSGSTIKIRGGSAQWWGLKNRLQQKRAYEFCYPVSSVVDTLAEYDLTGIFSILRSQGKGKENLATNEFSVRVNKLLAKPNPLQSWHQFRGQQVVYKKIFGFCPVLPIVPAGFEGQPWMATSIVNLPPWLFEAIPTRTNQTTATSIDEVVKEYKVTLLGKVITIKASDVLILEDSFMQDESTDFTLPLSRLVGLDMAVSNICAAMEADNVLLRKKGPLGFISHDAATKDQTSYLPMTKTQRRELQSALGRYGLSWDQYQYVISRVASKWVPMSYNVNELGTKETVVAGEKAICHRYRFPYILYEETDTTYANGDNAAATVYQTNVIPNGQKDILKYAEFFKAGENGCKFDYCFDHVAALQEDKKMAAESRLTLIQSLEKEYDRDLMTLNEFREKMGWDRQDGGDIYKSQVAESDQPLAVVLGVGGTTALITIITNPDLSQEAKESALQILFGLSPEDAARLAVEKEAEPQPNEGEGEPPGSAGNVGVEPGLNGVRVRKLNLKY